MFGSNSDSESDVESDLENDTPRSLENIREVTTPLELTLSGNIPQWLKGSLFTSSPGMFELEEGSVGHWLDGYAITSKYSISGNKIKFSSRYVKTSAYEKALSANKPVVPEWGTPAGTDSSKGYFSMLAFTPGDTSDNCVGSFLQLGSKLYAVSFSPYFHEIDPETLEVNETLYALNALGVTSFTPEAIRDQNGDLYVIGGATEPTFRHIVLKMTPDTKDNSIEEKFERVGTFPSRWSFGACGSRTCFAVTENYIVFIEVPWVINILKVAGTYLRGYAMRDWLDWRPEEGTRFYIMNKNTGEVIPTEIEAENTFVTSVIINAYEEGDKIVFDIFSLADPSPIEGNCMDLLKTSSVQEDYKGGEFHRYIIPVVEDIEDYPDETSLLYPENSPQDGKADAKRVGNQIIVSPELVRGNDSGFDLGLINSNFMGKKHSYVYAVSSPPSIFAKATISNGLTKVDLNSKKLLTWEIKPGQIPVEPVFIPNPNQLTEEDDGVLVSLIKHVSEPDEKDFLVVIDAKSMKEIGRAEFPLEAQAPGWFHAGFFSNIN